MAEKQKIGWLGLGKMGVPMSQNLVKKGYWGATMAKGKGEQDFLSLLTLNEELAGIKK